MQVCEQANVILLRNTGHGNEDCCKLHSSNGGRLAGDIKDDTLNGSALGFVNSHGKGKVEREGFSDLGSGKRDADVTSGVGELAAFLGR